MEDENQADYMIDYDLIIKHIKGLEDSVCVLEEIFFTNQTKTDINE